MNANNYRRPLIGLLLLALILQALPLSLDQSPGAQAQAQGELPPTELSSDQSPSAQAQAPGRPSGAAKQEELGRGEWSSTGLGRPGPPDKRASFAAICSHSSPRHDART